MPEIVIPGFGGGLSQVSPYPELNRLQDGSCFEMVNVELDELGNAYVCHGSSELEPAGTYSAAAQGLFYSASLNKLIVADTQDIFIVDPNTGSTSVTHSNVLGSATSKPTFVDWPLTDVVYISDGMVFGKTNGTSFTDLSASVPRGKGILVGYKNHLFSLGNAASGPCGVAVSDALTPETMTSANDFSCEAGGDQITAGGDLNGVLYIHKPRTIYAVFGNNFTGSYKDLEKIDLKCGAGAIHKNAWCIVNKIMFFIGYNGLFAFDGKDVFPIGGKLRQKLFSTYVRKDDVVEAFNLSDSDYVSLCPDSPAYGPELGRQLLRLALKTEEMDQQLIFKIDPERDVVVQLDLGFDRTIQYMTPALERNTVYYLNGAGGLSIFGRNTYWDTSAYPVKAEIVTHLQGFDSMEKRFRFVNVQPPYQQDIDVKIGFDGLFPTIDCQYDTQLNAIELPTRDCKGIQIRLSRENGGQPLAAAMKLEVDPVTESPNRSWKAARRESSIYTQSVAPLIKGSQETMVGGETSKTVTHGLGLKPKVVLVTLSGQFFDGYYVVTAISDTQFTVTFPSGVTASAGDKLHWIAIIESTHFHDSGAILRSVRFSNLNKYHYIQHNSLHYLNAISETSVVCVMKHENSAKHILTYIDNTEIGAKTNASGIVGDRCWMAGLYAASVDTFFRVGTGTINAGSITVPHGLGSTPSAVFVQFDNFTAVGQGAGFKMKLVSADATNITLSRDGANSLTFRWVAFK